MTLRKLLQDISGRQTREERGALFETLTLFLVRRMSHPAIPERRFRSAWYWAEWPEAWKSEEAGIDHVAQTSRGRRWAVQAKFKKRGRLLSKSELDSFLSESARACFHGRLVVSNAPRLSPHARDVLGAQEKRTVCLLLEELERMDLEWPASIPALRRVAGSRVPEMDAREQLVVDALRDADRYFDEYARWPRIRDRERLPSQLWAWPTYDAKLKKIGLSLTRLLAAHRGVAHGIRPRLHRDQVRREIEAYRSEHGRFPTRADGRHWMRRDQQMRLKRRGLGEQGTLELFIYAEFGVWTTQRILWSVDRILEAADLHRKLTGEWPTTACGDAPSFPPGVGWKGVDSALHEGSRDLPGGDSLAGLLARERGFRGGLSFEWIRARALEWKERHGTHPHRGLGQIPAADGLEGHSWASVQTWLEGQGTTLTRFLTEEGIRPEKVTLDLDLVHEWIFRQRDSDGEWPTVRTGRIRAAPQENWHALDQALRLGYRGLSGSTSLLREVEMLRDREDRAGREELLRAGAR